MVPQALLDHRLLDLVDHHGHRHEIADAPCALVRVAHGSTSAIAFRLLLGALAVALLSGLAEEALLQWKSPYLNQTFFLIRLAVYFAAWIAIGTWYFRTSVKQDETGDPALTRTLRVWSGPGLVLYALAAPDLPPDYNGWTLQLDPTVECRTDACSDDLLRLRRRRGSTSSGRGLSGRGAWRRAGRRCPRVRAWPPWQRGGLPRP